MVYYSNPVLKSRSQRDMIAFIRQVRRMSQQTLGEKIGIKSNRVRNMICRMERKDRAVKPDRLKKIAEVLDVNIKMLERWTFKDPEQLYYMLLWIEELCPGMAFRKDNELCVKNETHKTLLRKYPEWREMKIRYVKGLIDYDEYLDWKLGKYKGSFKEDGR